MKGPLHLDRARHNFGDAAPAVLQILAEWEDIDWFVPPPQPALIAEELLHQHQRLARQELPEKFAESLTIYHQSGGWPLFVAYCQQVRRAHGYDWKMGPIKSLLCHYGERHQFSRVALAQQILIPGAELDDRCLLVPYRDSVFWGSLGPNLSFDSLDDEAREAAHFYFFYAHGDAFQAVEWQLIEPSAPASQNPLLPLLRCYASGHYPFVFSPTEVVLFSFAMAKTDTGGETL